MDTTLGWALICPRRALHRLTSHPFPTRALTPPCHPPPSLLRSTGAADGALTSIDDGHYSACTRFLLQSWHAIFLDAQLQLAGAGVGAARLPLLRAASQRYRRAMQEAMGRAEAGKDASNGAACALVDAEVEDMRTVLALWHLGEIPALHVGAEALLAGEGAGGSAAGGEAAAELRGSPPLALLQWLRDNFWGPTSEAVVLNVVNALRNPAAAVAAGGSGALATPPELNAWDVVVKLALEGEPNDAGRLLHLVAARSDCRETAQLAEILKGYPLLAVALEGSAQLRTHARALGEAWAQWRAGALAFRRALRATPAGSAFLARAAGLPGLLLDVLCGDTWGGLSRLRLQEGTRVPGYVPNTHPYRSWTYEAGARLLYGERCPLEYTAGALAGLLRESIMRARVADAQGTGSAAVELEAEEGGLESAFVRILGGDSALVLTQFNAYRQPWAAAHFADLLWHSSCCGSGGGTGISASASSSSSSSSSGAAAAAAAAAVAIPTLWPPYDAPLRAHLLLAHAVALPTYGELLGRIALSYVLAAFPQAALRACGIPPEAYAEELGVYTFAAPVAGCGGAGAAGQLDFSALAEGLGGLGAHSLSPAARAAKLAMLSGSSAAAGGVLQHLLLVGQPMEEERTALTAVRLCQRLGCWTAAARLSATWVQRCLASGSAAGGGLGSALAWALGVRGGGGAGGGRSAQPQPQQHLLRTVAARLKRHLDGAMREEFSLALQGVLAPRGEAPPPATPLKPWFPRGTPPLLYSRLEAVLQAMEECAAMAAVDDALAAVGHDSEDGEVLEGRALSNSAALVAGCEREPLLRHVMLQRRFLAHCRAQAFSEALGDLRELAAAPLHAASLAQDCDAARLLRFASALGLLQGFPALASARQGLLALVLREERRLAEALYDAALREGEGPEPAAAACSSASAGAAAGEAFVALMDQPLGAWGLAELKKQLQ